MLDFLLAALILGLLAAAIRYIVKAKKSVFVLLQGCVCFPQADTALFVCIVLLLF